MSSIIHGFPAIIPENPKCLILGTMPSMASLDAQFYYAHPRNAFWPMMSRAMQRPLVSVEDKKSALIESHILLWDVLHSCQRTGSLDSAIKNPQVNDFESLFKSLPDLKKVIFNGKTAESLFKKYVQKQQQLPSDLILLTLPSTSPANASLSLEDKWLFWREIL